MHDSATGRELSIISIKVKAIRPTINTMPSCALGDEVVVAMKINKKLMHEREACHIVAEVGRYSRDKITGQ
jgi:hypothetical protein